MISNLGSKNHYYFFFETRRIYPFSLRTTGILAGHGVRAQVAKKRKKRSDF
jgi:hypothetical protein